MDLQKNITSAGAADRPEGGKNDRILAEGGKPAQAVGFEEVVEQIAGDHIDGEKDEDCQVENGDDVRRNGCEEVGHQEYACRKLDDCNDEIEASRGAAEDPAEGPSGLGEVGAVAPDAEDSQGDKHNAQNKLENESIADGVRGSWGFSGHNCFVSPAYRLGISAV
jgi:hypothetical protein